MLGRYVHYAHDNMRISMYMTTFISLAAYDHGVRLSTQNTCPRYAHKQRMGADPCPVQISISRHALRGYAHEATVNDCLNHKDTKVDAARAYQHDLVCYMRGGQDRLRPISAKLAGLITLRDFTQAIGSVGCLVLNNCVWP